MISKEALDEMIRTGELHKAELEKDAVIKILRHNEFYIIQVAMLKTLKFVRDYDKQD